MTEHRDRQRLDLSKLAFAKHKEYARGGLLKDISSSGARLEFVYPTGRAEHSFSLGEHVDVEIDGFDTLTGEVTRVSETGIAIHFDTSGENEDELIAEIMEAATVVPETAAS
jgi:hypothetical protein